MNMHKNDLVVVLRTLNDDKPLREFPLEPNKDDLIARIRNVYIPVNTEYALHFKNFKPVRRRVEVEIDGAVIGNWILQAGTKDHPYEVKIERYQDEAKHFKTASVNDPNVTDPGSSENGIVRVTSYEEEVHYFPLTPISWPSWPSWPHNPYWPNQSPTWIGSNGNLPLGGSPTSAVWGTASMQGSVGGSSLHDGSAPCSYTVDCCSTVKKEVKETLATIAGSHSNQQFTQTLWYGDNYYTKTVFEFHLLAKTTEQPVVKAETKPPVPAFKNTKDAKFCSDCGYKRIDNAKFCHNCGTPYSS
jgi:hypothetical protein